MGAFFLARRTSDDRAGRKLSARNAFTTRGFAHIQDISNDRFDILYCRKINAKSDSLFRRDAENFCFSTGTMIYKGRIGPEAAKVALQDYVDGALETEELFGNFALVFCVRGTVDIYTDAQGVYNVWHSLAQDCYSSSFLALVSALDGLTLNEASVYPYVFQEAVFGGDTVFNEIGRLKVKTAVRLGADSSTLDALETRVTELEPGDIDHYVRVLHERLGRQFSAITRCFGDDIDSALSGGYDSRLLLALCREQGKTPHVHVYGRANAADVQIASRICQGEGIALAHEDKSDRELVSPEQFPSIVEQNFHAFQGLCADGILDNGADLETRRARTESGRLLLNGGGGEVMRNFFYLPDRPYSPRQLLWSFYSQFDPAVCTDAFSMEAYYEHFEKQMAELVGLRARLDRKTIEYLYAGFRCTYWMGQNNSINNQLGWFLTPFVEEFIAAYAHQVPLKYKNFGRFEAAVINAASPSLAGYPSDYGHPFTGAVPLKRKLGDMATVLRPPWLRRLTYRMKKRSRADWPYYLGRDYIDRLLPEGLTYLSRYFDIDKVNDAGQFKRICTLEYLLQKVQPVGAPTSASRAGRAAYGN